MDSDVFYKKSDRISYNLLVESITQLKIYHSYSDSRKIGGDDSLFDYISILVWSDLYIYQTLIKVLEPHFRITYDLCYIRIGWHYDRGVARHPREALYPYDPQTEFRLWLILEIQKHYNENQHIKNREKLEVVWKTFTSLFYVETDFSPVKNIYGDILYHTYKYSLIEWKSEKVIDTISNIIINFDKKK